MVDSNLVSGGKTAPNGFDSHTLPPIDGLTPIVLVPQPSASEQPVS
jgi:hypothetical protein